MSPVYPNRPNLPKIEPTDTHHRWMAPTQPAQPIGRMPAPNHCKIFFLLTFLLFI